ncbi:uncharacterized protein C8Q71DRAFT_439728 [Rhodofomes roseus]|uniref:Condensation domain-containing protein n=1 Tax=Rhodofomes roseus TaxID=34475 RepID=A0ABQ8KR56_9APHY|nr:uncharacterized protein C8Q71DRAFT_439728 [Rhodofomes roseus]KAH9841118.1 hypothetical protein C8Q71DRAFT_439728 [Rhodofomes roseus]
MHPLENEPSWTTITRDGNTLYTRPLLASELVSDQFGRWADGIVDMAYGLRLRTSLPFDEVASRLRYAIAHLRFTSPLIASALEEGIHDPRFRSWVYAPVQSARDALDWAEDAVAVLPDRMNADDLVSKVVKTRLPYVLPSGRELIFRCFLARFPATTPDGVDGKLKDDEVSVVFHSPHSISDARSTLNAFSLVLEWMSNPAHEPLETLVWGTEAENLPIGPVTATGGPRPNWDTEGIALMQKIAREHANPARVLSLTPQRMALGTPAEVVKAIVVLDEDQTARVVKATKAAGFTVTHLLEAAHKLAILSFNDTTDPSVRDARVMNPMIPMAHQRRYQVPPHDGKGHFVSAISWVPASVPVADILSAEPDSPKGRLLATMRGFKAYYDEYQRNPHLPHVCAASTVLAPPVEPVVSSNPYCAVISNIGLIEDWVLDEWYRDDAAEAEGPVIEAMGFAVGERLTAPVPSCHVWTMRSKIHVQLMTNDQFDEQYVRSFRDEILNILLLMGLGSSPSVVQ